MHFLLASKWTMHKAGEEIIPVANSDDKRQVTGVFAATIKGEFLYRALSPKVVVPDGWEVWHSDNHWSNEKHHLKKLYFPFLEEKEKL